MADEVDKQGCKGGVFWHSQDDDSFKESGDLMIGFVASENEVRNRIKERFGGPDTPLPVGKTANELCDQEFDAVAVEVANEAVAEFKRQGLNVQWNGTAARRIEIS